MTNNKGQNFKIILEYIKDLSIETPSVTTLKYVRENLSNYIMDIDIGSSILKNKAIEVNTKLTLQDKNNVVEKAFFEIKYSTVITLNNEVNDKNVISKIILCDLQKEIYPRLESIFLNIIKNSND